MLTHTDLVIFLIAGILGSLSMDITVSGRSISLAWLLIAIWAVLRLFTTVLA